MLRICLPAIAFLLYPTICEAKTIIPIRLAIGWGSHITELAKIPDNVPLVEKLKGQPTALCFVYDRLWFIVPIWTSNGKYVLAVDADVDEEFQRGLYELTDADIADFKAALGYDPFSKPFVYYVPQGWLFLAALMAFSGFASLFSKDPHGEFRSLWADPAYRRGLGWVFLIEDPLPEQFEGLLLEKEPYDVHHTLERAAERMTELGHVPAEARKKLEFMLGYVLDNKLVRVLKASPLPDTMEQTARNDQPPYTGPQSK